MGASGSAVRKLSKDQLKQITAGSVLSQLKERTLQILYGRFTYLYITSFPDPGARETAGQNLDKAPISSPNIAIDIARINELQEFQFNPFLEKILAILRHDAGGPYVNFEAFVRLMVPFCYETPPDFKKQMLFRIYDKQGS